MTIKGKKLKVIQRAKELSPDFDVERYLVKGIEFDVGIWYKYEDSVAGKGVMLLPYQGKVWTEDKIWFPSLLNMNRFCMLCNCKVIIESD